MIALSPFKPLDSMIAARSEVCRKPSSARPSPTFTSIESSVVLAKNVPNSKAPTSTELRVLGPSKNRNAPR